MQSVDFSIDVEFLKAAKKLNACGTVRIKRSLENGKRAQWWQISECTGKTLLQQVKDSPQVLAMNLV